MPQFQLRYGLRSDLDPESLVAADALEAIVQARRRLTTEGVSDAVLFRDGVVLQTFSKGADGAPSATNDTAQLFASAGIYVFASGQQPSTHGDE